MKPMTIFCCAAAVRSRPELKKPNVGRPSAAEKALTPAPAAAKQAVVAAPVRKKDKQKRKSWSKGPGLGEISAAMAAWRLEIAKPKKGRVA